MVILIHFTKCSNVNDHYESWIAPRSHYVFNTFNLIPIYNIWNFNQSSQLSHQFSWIFKVFTSAYIIYIDTSLSSLVLCMFWDTKLKHSQLWQKTSSFQAFQFSSTILLKNNEHYVQKIQVKCIHQQIGTTFYLLLLA